MKALFEKRNALITEMQGIVSKAKTEVRAIAEDENIRCDAIKAEIEGIDKTIKTADEARAFDMKTPKSDTKEGDIEVRAFGNYIRGIVETRADANLTTADNGAIIPSTIANKIIEKVVEICPIYQLATKYNIGGTLSIPFYDESTQAISMAYATEFTELTSTSGKFDSIELKGFLAGVLTKISKSLANNAQFDIVSYTVTAMAKSISRWIENELLNGTTDKITGLNAGVTQIVTAASATAFTLDEIIDVQEKVPDVYQSAAIWIMSKATRTAIRKFKNSDGDYIMERDATSKWGYTLFGKDVYTSANMSDITAAKTAIYYGDMSGLAVKLSEDVNIEVLREKFATQHALGVIGWIEIDSKVEDAQKISKLVMKAV